jgi:hypothetical protein
MERAETVNVEVRDELHSSFLAALESPLVLVWLLQVSHYHSWSLSILGGF